MALPSARALQGYAFAPALRAKPLPIPNAISSVRDSSEKPTARNGWCIGMGADL
jgi:hypothetical protein